MNRRSGEKERLDMHEMDEGEIAEYFNFILFTNRYGGGHRTILKALGSALSSWPKERTVEVLDVGCGIGDAASAISGWGRKNGLSIRYKGIDNNSRIIGLAKSAKAGDAEYFTGDLFDKALPEADIVIASMVFHHLGEEDIKEGLVNLLARSRHALIINDLTRSLASYFACYILTRFVKNRASRHDALLSIRKGFHVEEIQALLDRLNIKGVIKKQFFGRFSAIIFI